MPRVTDTIDERTTVATEKSEETETSGVYDYYEEPEDEQSQKLLALAKKLISRPAEAK